MRKGVKILLIVVALVASFVLGWRLMPKVWPAVKTNVIYRVFPDLKPETTETEYVPASNTELTDAIAASDSLIYYFFKPQCPYCMQIDPLMRGIPETVTLPDGTQSKVRLVVINKLDPEGEKLINEYYEAYSIPEDKRYVPAVVIGDMHLMPGSEIIGQLMDALLEGKGLETPTIGGQLRK